MARIGAVQPATLRFGVQSGPQIEGTQDFVRPSNGSHPRRRQSPWHGSAHHAPRFPRLRFVGLGINVTGGRDPSPAPGGKRRVYRLRRHWRLQQLEWQYLECPRSRSCDPRWPVRRPAKDMVETGENYDCVVIGGGISGLAAALFFQRSAGPGVKCLILENHPIFGGEAKQNEFLVDGKRL